MSREGGEGAAPEPLVLRVAADGEGGVPDPRAGGGALGGDNGPAPDVLAGAEVGMEVDDE